MGPCGGADSSQGKGQCCLNNMCHGLSLIPPWRYKQQRRACRPLRISCSVPCRVSRIRCCTLGRLGRITRRLRLAVRLDARWRLLPGDKCRRTPSPTQCNEPTALAGLHSSKQMRIEGTQQHSRCRREDIQFLFGSTWFFLCILPTMQRMNLPANEEGRLCVSAQRLGEKFSVSPAIEIGLRVLPRRRRLDAGVPSTQRIPSCGVRCDGRVWSIVPEVIGLRHPNLRERMTVPRGHSHFLLSV